MTTEPTTDRAAWLEEVRADVDKANSPSPVNGRYGAELRIVERHTPALLHALEAVEAIHARVHDGWGGPDHAGTWTPTFGCAGCSTEDTRVFWPCETLQAIERAREQA